MLKIINAQVTFGRDAKPALRNFSLTLNQGEFVVIIGNNGAGKSTLLNLIAGCITPNTGSIIMADKDVTNLPSFKRASLVAKVMQSPSKATVGSLTVADNLAFALQRGKKRALTLSSTAERRALFIEKLRHLGMGLEDRLDDLVQDLSGGQRQVLSLVMATLNPSQVLLLDEHTAALDPKTAEMVMLVTNRLIRENGITALMVTHNMKNAIQYGDRTLLLQDGAIARELSPEDKKSLSPAELITLFHSS